MHIALPLHVSIPFCGSWGFGASAVPGLQLFLTYLQSSENGLRFQNSLGRAVYVSHIAMFNWKLP